MTERQPQKNIQFIDGIAYVDLVEATGRKESHLPRELRDSEYPHLTNVSSFTAAMGDPWTNPCSGGVVGLDAICEELSISTKTFHRHAKHGGLLNDIPSFGNGSAEIYAAHVSSLDNSAVQIEESRNKKYRESLEKANEVNPKKQR